MPPAASGDYVGFGFSTSNASWVPHRYRIEQRGTANDYTRAKEGSSYDVDQGTRKRTGAEALRWHWQYGRAFHTPLFQFLILTHWHQVLVGHLP